MVHGLCAYMRLAPGAAAVRDGVGGWWVSVQQPRCCAGVYMGGACMVSAWFMYCTCTAPKVCVRYMDEDEDVRYRCES